jgi:catalase
VAGAVGPTIALPASAAQNAPASRAKRGVLADSQYAEGTAEQSVDVLEKAYGVHAGQRRNHTKGVASVGTFRGNPAAKAYSCSLLFSGQSIEVVARFSLAGGDPV